MEYAIVEKANRLAVHGVFDTRERAEAFLAGTIPLYVARSHKNLKLLEGVKQAVEASQC